MAALTRANERYAAAAGTLDSGDFAAKFGGCRRYFLAGAWRQDFDAEPLLLFICADDRAEEHVARASR